MCSGKLFYRGMVWTVQVWTLPGVPKNSVPWKAGRESGDTKALPLPAQAACGSSHALPQCHSGVQLSVHLSTHPSTILLSPRSPMKALPSRAGGECRARASCSSTKQDQRRRRIHRKAQPDPTSLRAFPDTSGKQQQTFCFCSPDQGTLTGHNWQLCMEPTEQSLCA